MNAYFFSVSAAFLTGFVAGDGLPFVTTGVFGDGFGDFAAGSGITLRLSGEFWSRKATNSATMPIIIATAGTHPPARHMGAKYQNRSKRTSGANMAASGTQSLSAASGGRANAVRAATTTYMASNRNHSWVELLPEHRPWIRPITPGPASSVVVAVDVATGADGFTATGFDPAVLPCPESVAGVVGVLVKPGAMIEPSGATVNETIVRHVGLPGGEERRVSEIGSPPLCMGVV